MVLKSLYRGLRDGVQSLGTPEDSTLSELINDVNIFNRYLGDDVSGFDIHRLEQYIKNSYNNFNLISGSNDKNNLDFTSIVCYSKLINMDEFQQEPIMGIKLVQLIDSSFLSESAYRRTVNNLSNSLNTGFGKGTIFENHMLLHTLSFKNQSIDESTRRLRHDSTKVPVYVFPK